MVCSSLLCHDNVHCTSYKDLLMLWKKKVTGDIIMWHWCKETVYLCARNPCHLIVHHSWITRESLHHPSIIHHIFFPDMIWKCSNSSRRPSKFELQSTNLCLMQLYVLNHHNGIMYKVQECSYSFLNNYA